MANEITDIKISFPIGVELDGEDQKALHELVNRICEKNQPQDKSMWVFGVGSQIESMGIVKGDDHITFNDSVFSMDIAIQEKSKAKKFVDQYIKENYSEDYFTEQVDEFIPEYLNDDWQDEFDTEYEAYIEQGRGEAESQAFYSACREVFLQIQDNGLIANKSINTYIAAQLKDQFSIFENL